MDQHEAALDFRAHNDEDLNFIRSSWGSSYFMNNNYNKAFTADEFHEKHRRLRDEILSRPETQIIVACAKQSPELILGYIIFEGVFQIKQIVHYVYVKEAFKDEKIAKSLLKRVLNSQTPLVVTHMTPKVAKILFNKKKELGEFYYVPFMAI